MNLCCIIANIYINVISICINDFQRNFECGGRNHLETSITPLSLRDISPCKGEKSYMLGLII